MAKGDRGGRRGGGGVNPANIKNTRDLISARSENPEMTDAVLTVSRDMYDEYQDAGLTQFLLVDIGGKDSSTIAYYDGDNIGFNTSYYDAETMNSAYDKCVESGFHPSRGDKSGAEAVAAHEFGHALTDKVGERLGFYGSQIDDVATRIVTEARKEQGTHRGVVQMAKAISGYATHSNAEAVAEAVSDVYCNGDRASAESRAIVNVVNRYLK